MLLKRLVKALLRRVLSFINNHPKLRQYVLIIINRLGLYGMACTLYARTAYGEGMRGPHNFIPTDIAHLSPRARQIYADLKAAIDRRQKENN